MSAVPAASLRRSVAEMTVAGAVFRATGALGGVVAAHLLGPAGRGGYAIVVLAGSALGLLATGGLQFWVARRLGTGTDAGAVRPVLRRHGRLATTGAAAVGLVLLAAAPGDVRAAVGVVVVLALANAASLVLLAVPTGLGRTRVAALALGSGGVTWLAFLGLAAAAGWRSPAVIALGAVASHVAIAASCRRSVRRLPIGAAEARPIHGRALRAHLAPGLGEVVLLGAFRVDIVLVAALADARAAGLYAVATSLAEVLWLVPDALATVVLPRSASADGGQLRRARTLALGVTGALALPLLLGARPLVTAVFGDDYRGAADAVPWLVLAALALGSWKVDSAVLVGRGRGSVRLASAALAMGVVVVGDVLLVPAHGVEGAAVACALGYAVAAGWAALELQRPALVGTAPLAVGS